MNIFNKLEEFFNWNAALFYASIVLVLGLFLLFPILQYIAIGSLIALTVYNLWKIYRDEREGSDGNV